MANLKYTNIAKWQSQMCVVVSMFQMWSLLYNNLIKSRSWFGLTDSHIPACPPTQSPSLSSPLTLQSNPASGHVLIAEAPSYHVTHHRHVTRLVANRENKQYGAGVWMYIFINALVTMAASPPRR